MPAPLVRLAATAILFVLTGAGAAATAAPAPADTSRVLPAWMQFSLAGGIGGMTAPAAPRRQYQPGIAGTATLRASAGSRVRWLAAVEYQDLPAIRDVQQVGNYDSGGVWVRGFDGGNQLAAIGGIEARVVGSFFLRGAGGIAHHNAGQVLDIGFPDLADALPEPFAAVPDRDGWGPTWSVGASYEFQPAPRTRLAVDAQFATARSGAGDLLRFFTMKVGYRLQ